jgi:hypothetical protein
LGRDLIRAPSINKFDLAHRSGRGATAVDRNAEKGAVAADAAFASIKRNH